MSGKVKISQFPLLTSSNLHNDDIIHIISREGNNNYKNKRILLKDFIIPTSSISNFALVGDFDTLINRPTLISSSNQFTSSDNFIVGNLTASNIIADNANFNNFLINSLTIDDLTVVSSSQFSGLTEIFDIVDVSGSLLIKGKLDLTGSLNVNGDFTVNTASIEDLYVINNNGVFINYETSSFDKATINTLISSNSELSNITASNINVLNLESFSSSLSFITSSEMRSHIINALTSSFSELNVDGEAYINELSASLIEAFYIDTTYVSSSFIGTGAITSSILETIQAVIKEAFLNNITGSVSLTGSLKLNNSDLIVSGNILNSGDLINNGSVTFNGTQSLNGETYIENLFSTSSHAMSSSYSKTSSFSNTSSFSITSSFALNAANVLNINSGSFVVTASGANDNTTASYALMALTSSYTLAFTVTESIIQIDNSGSFVVTASGANDNTTASYALTSSKSDFSISSSFSYTSSYIKAENIDGIVKSSSFSLTASFVSGNISNANFAINAGNSLFADTASLALFSNTSSISFNSLNSNTSSFSLTSNISNFVLTASSETGFVLTNNVRQNLFITNSFVRGDIIAASSSGLILAQADSLDNSNVIGIVEYATSSFVTVVYSGYVLDITSSLETGSLYYLSPNVAGKSTKIKPTGLDVVKPIFIALNNKDIIFVNQKSQLGQIDSSSYSINSDFSKTSSYSTYAETASFLTKPGIRAFVNTTNSFSPGDVIYVDGNSNLFKAQANTISSSNAIGIVETATTQSFVLLTNGALQNVYSGLSPNTIYYLSPTTAGDIIPFKPTGSSDIIKPILLATSDVDGLLLIENIAKTQFEDKNIETSSLAITSSYSIFSQTSNLAETASYVNLPTFNPNGTRDTYIFPDSVTSSINIGDVLRLSGSIPVKSIAKSIFESEAIGVVESLNGNDATIVFSGYINTTSSIFSPGELYYLSPSISGSLTTIRPTGSNEFIKNIGYGLTNNTAIIAIGPSLPVTSSYSINSITSKNVSDEVSSSAVIRTTVFDSVSTSVSAGITSSFLNVTVNGSPFKIQLYNV